MRFVLFVGPRQSGKDTAAAILKEANKARGKLSFAGPLKEICAKVAGLPDRYLHDPILKEKELDQPIIADRRFWRQIKGELIKYVSELEPGTDLIRYNIDRVSITGLEGRVFKTPREMLQQVGTEFIRDRVFARWHLEAAFGEENLSKQRQGYVYCITDTRFLNEYEFLVNRFGEDLKVYYIERPEAEQELEKATHRSELEILKVKEQIPKNCIVKNDGSLEDFKKKVLKLTLPATNKKRKGKSKSKKGRFVYGTAKR